MAELVGIILTLYALTFPGVGLRQLLGVAISPPGVLKALLEGLRMLLLAMQLPGVLKSTGTEVALHGVTCCVCLIPVSSTFESTLSNSFNERDQRVKIFGMVPLEIRSLLK